MREFVRLSVTDWVAFVKSFTQPDYQKGELWKVSNTPLLDIDISFKIAKKKDAKDKKKKTSPTPDSNTIVFKPGLDKCVSFFDE